MGWGHIHKVTHTQLPGHNNNNYQPPACPLFTQCPVLPTTIGTPPPVHKLGIHHTRLNGNVTMGYTHNKQVNNKRTNVYNVLFTGSTIITINKNKAWGSTITRAQGGENQAINKYTQWGTNNTITHKGIHNKHKWLPQGAWAWGLGSGQAGWGWGLGRGTIHTGQPRPRLTTHTGTHTHTRAGPRLGTHNGVCSQGGWGLGAPACPLLSPKTKNAQGKSQWHYACWARLNGWIRHTQ